jgi:molybdopterin converting factor subunit 1
MITVKLFAQLREAAGAERLDLPQHAAGTVGSLREELIRLRPALAGVFAGRTVLAVVNRRYAGPDDPVADGDEVAFLPPVSGG